MPGGLHPPLSLVFTWPSPSTHPVLRSDFEWIICIVFMVITAAVVALRMWTRCFIQRKVNIDDYLILAALFFTTGMGICICLVMAKYHFDRHVWDAIATPSLLVEARQVIWAIEALNLLGTGLTKTSILFFVNQIARRNKNKPLTYMLWGTIVFVILSTVVFEITLLTECQPFSAFWMQLDFAYAYGGAKWHCVNEGAKLLAAGIVSTVQDFIVTTLPLLLVWDLHMARNKKIGVLAVFAVGYLVCAMGIARTIYSYKVFFKTYDATWVGPILLIWTHMELHIGIICACAPALKAFATHHKLMSFESLRSASSRRRSHSSGVLDVEPKSQASSHGTKGLYTQALDELDESELTSGHEKMPNEF